MLSIKDWKWTVDITSIFVNYHSTNNHICRTDHSKGYDLPFSAFHNFILLLTFHNVMLHIILQCKPYTVNCKPLKSFVAILFLLSAILPQHVRAITNWIMIFLDGEKQQASQFGGWEWNGIKSPFKSDFEWFKNFKPVNSNDVLISTYPKAGTTWHQV